MRRPRRPLSFRPFLRRSFSAERRRVAPSLSASLAAVLAAPIAEVASRLLTHPVLPHAIAASRRVFTSKEAGRVSYYEDDSASGPPVILLHDLGIVGTAFAMRGLFEAFRGARPVVAVDMPGFGFSERRDRPLSRTAYVRFLEELLSDVSRRYGASVDVVAAGIAADLAASAALSTSRVLRSLVLLSPSGLDRLDRAAQADWGASAIVKDRLRAISKTLLGRAADGALGRAAHGALSSRLLLRHSIHRSSDAPLDQGLLDYVYAAARQPRAWSAPLAALRGEFAPLSDEEYAQIRVPVLFLHGDDARAGSTALARLVARHSTFRCDRVFGGGTTPHLTLPTQTAAVIRAFHATLAVKPQLRLIRGEQRTQGMPPFSVPSGPSRPSRTGSSRAGRRVGNAQRGKG